MAEMLHFQQHTLVWLDETESDGRNFFSDMVMQLEEIEQRRIVLIQRTAYQCHSGDIMWYGVVAYQLLKETVNTNNFLISFAVTCCHSYSNMMERVQDLFSFWMICPCITPIVSLAPTRCWYTGWVSSTIQPRSQSCRTSVQLCEVLSAAAQWYCQWYHWFYPDNSFSLHSIA